MRKKNKHKVKITTPESKQQPDTQPVADAAETESTAGENAVESEVDTLRRELADARDQFLRSRAEQQNMQKRFAQEKSDSIRYANVNLVRDLLGVLDDLERTLEHGSSDDAMLSGVRLVRENFVKVLATHNIEVIDPEGEPFDPRFHEALMQQPTDEHPPGAVMQVVQRGYRLHDRVIRAAKVIIAAGASNESAEEATSAAGKTGQE